MEPKTIPLKYPVEVTATNGTKSMLTEVTIRRAKAKDLRNIPDGAFTDDPKVAGIALSCGIPYEAAAELDLEDVFEIMKSLPNLMPGFLGTGEKSSGESPVSTTSPQT